MKTKIIAASALIASSFTPLSLPVLVAPASAQPSYDELQQICNDNADTFSANNKILPNDMWYWNPIATLVSSTPDGSGTVEGYSFNPADRTIHAIVSYDDSTEVYNILCQAMNPGDNVNQHFTYTIYNYTVDTGEATTDRPAVCAPAKTSKSGFPTAWTTPPGNAYLLGSLTCTGLAAEYPGGPDLIDWSSLS